WDATPLKDEPIPGLFTLPGHSDRINGVSFSPDGQHLASAGMDGLVLLWNAKNLQRTRTLRSNNGPIQSVAFSADSKRLASASNSEDTAAAANPRSRVAVWELSTGQELLRLPGGGLRVTFSPDGRWLAFPAQDIAAEVCDARTGTPLRAFPDLSRTGTVPCL